ncbi:SDR family oxidoreductase [Cohnella algarum]|uniref:SDR family oxidoreductase n=1 Tax=Cohnella algarum TaxID=2044859 RepID=UPI0019677F06|nr:SDR family oxidoreductase [Cohnella algarum]MBN2980564.1 SDR family oxidoreductase [Cohnella algarum]
MNIFITGANRGIGLAIVKALLERGHRVVAGIRPASRLEEMERLRGRYPADALQTVEAEVGDEASIRAAAQTMRANGVRFDAIVNNAAIAVGRKSSIEEADLDDFERTFQTNAFGPVRVCKHFVPLLRAGDGPSFVINMSSASGIIEKCGSKDYSYAMSKAALNMFTGILRNQLADRNVTVYAVHPGWVRTDQGGMEAPLDPSEPAAQLCDLLEGKTRPEHGRFFIHSDGSPLPF